MRPQQVRHIAQRLRSFSRELDRRKVLRTLAIYCAMAWGAVAAAPDLLEYLDLPPWIFTALVVLLALGLPLALAASWHFEVLFETPTTPSPPVPSPSRAPDSEEGNADRTSEPGARPGRRLRWYHVALGAVTVYVVVVGAASLLPNNRGEPPLRVLVYEAPTDLFVATGDAIPLEHLIRQSLGWMLTADVLARPRPAEHSIRAYSREARAAGADYYVMADVADGGNQPTISVTTRSVASGDIVFQATGGGPAEAVAEAAGRIAVQLAQQLASIRNLRFRLRPEVVGATSSPDALGHYLEGSRLFAGVRFDQAADAFGRAIRADSGFIPAYYRGAVVERWRWDHEAGIGIVEAGLRRPNLSPRWARLLEAQRAYLLRDTELAVDLYADVTLHYPELLDGWVELGEALFHYGGFVGHDPSEARIALVTALSTDSLIAPVEHHLAELALIRGDLREADVYIERMASEHPLRPAVELARALRFGGDAEKSEALASLQRMDLRTISLLVAHLSFDPSQRQMVGTVAEQLLSPARSPEDRLRGTQYILMAASDEREWSTALARWREVGAGTTFDPWIVHSHLAGRPVPEAPRMMEWARSEVAAGRLPDFQVPLDHGSRGAFQAVVHDAVLIGDSADVTYLLDRLENAIAPQRTDPSREVLSAALRSRLALLAHDTTLAIDELSTALSRTFEPVVTFYPLATMAPERLLLSRLARATGRTPLAVRWRNSFFRSMSFGDLVYQAWVPDVTLSEVVGTPQR
ncbi:MAG TPA: hypothetical protein VM198_04335 [Longimicrobiales bacterium]|nr:hypothetical protein [Longimicrobiales bacterium]